MNHKEFCELIQEKVDKLEGEASETKELSRRLSLKDQILILTELQLDVMQDEAADMTDYLYEQEKDRRAGL